jgi:hypothetical protein
MALTPTVKGLMMRTRARQVNETLERRLAAFEEIERSCAAVAGVLPGGALEEIWHAITKWYGDNLSLMICELAQKCSRRGATFDEAIDALHAELNLGRVRWRQLFRSPAPTLPNELDEVRKIAFVLLRAEMQSGKELPLSRTHLRRILGPHFPNSLKCRPNPDQKGRSTGQRRAS